MSGALFHTVFEVAAYELEATLDSGQAFRWARVGRGWEGVIGDRWVRVERVAAGLKVDTLLDPGEWSWLRNYLAIDLDPDAVAATFPPDAVLHEAVQVYRGLRVLRQDPWECLASFILSSTKQIVQIRQIVAMLARRFGRPVEVPAGRAPTFSFPSAADLAAADEAALRDCKMGFRAPYLLGTAREVAGGRLDLPGLSRQPLEVARAALMELPGVGRKIADCVLLFGLGFSAAFPVDVWVLRVLRELYFPRRPPAPARLRRFSETHFGPFGGHAQQYLFHWRRHGGRVASAATTAAQ